MGLGRLSFVELMFLREKKRESPSEYAPRQMRWRWRTRRHVGPAASLFEQLISAEKTCLEQSVSLQNISTRIPGFDTGQGE